MDMSVDGEKVGSHFDPPFRRELLPTATDFASGQTVVPLLPTTYRHRYRVQLVSSNVNSFLQCEFDVSRLNRVHKWLWLCGLPNSPRPLHYQRIKKRDIVITEQIDLHLVWSPSRIFIKPLPRFLLSPQFWQQHICPDTGLYRTAFGFLLSYIALIEREVDFQLATSLSLIPPEVTWAAWLAFAEEVVLTSSQTRSYFSADETSPSYSQHRVPVNCRFYYGELRLGRLNWIYRLYLGRPRGYLSGCTTYGAFVRDNANSFITLFAYTTIVLSAMQVGLATQWLSDSYAFGMASYVFSVFSIVAPLFALIGLFCILVVLFAVNLSRTLRIRWKRKRQGVGV
ncbi:uncharacterized protein EI97DRAFT_495528 [Westerdykella ornata]|uniref:Uncharacterized protein n=1 Tax=Westerdykella ornata TaxID=318751 RepID=A0A6A6JFR9_WESOR|nr:uncharacterized protein EI97DRAFT_495528 [Westerdykella ornata]KAF2274039.1 hypothetical protein EI97DRAFT_495528 [Westerdykella ornata]